MPPGISVLWLDPMRRLQERVSRLFRESTGVLLTCETVLLKKARRPKYLFSGLTKCGVCGGGVHVYTGNRLACYASRGTGTCANRLTIRRDEVETRVLTVLRDQLLNRELFEEFCREFAQEMNRLQSTERARQSAVRQELSAVKRDIAKLIEAIKNDVPIASIKDELGRLEHRKTELELSVEANPELRPLLHPGMADLYRRKVADLCLALEDEEARTQASEAIRGLLDEIVLVPEGQTLRLLVKGNLAAIAAVCPKCETLQIARNGRLGAYGNVGCGGPIPTIPYAGLVGCLVFTLSLPASGGAASSNPNWRATFLAKSGISDASRRCVAGFALFLSFGGGVPADGDSKLGSGQGLRRWQPLPL